MCFCTSSRSSAISRCAAFDKQLCQRKGSDALDDRGQQHKAHEPLQPRQMMLVDDVVDQELRGGGQHEAGEPVDHHQHEAQREQRAARAHQLPDFRPDCLQPLEIRWLLNFFCWRTQSVVGLRRRRIRFIITALSHIWLGARAGL